MDNADRGITVTKENHTYGHLLSSAKVDSQGHKSEWFIVRIQDRDLRAEFRIKRVNGSSKIETYHHIACQRQRFNLRPEKKDVFSIGGPFSPIGSFFLSILRCGMRSFRLIGNFSAIDRWRASLVNTVHVWELPKWKDPFRDEAQGNGECHGRDSSLPSELFGERWNPIAKVKHAVRCRVLLVTECSR